MASHRSKDSDWNFLSESVRVGLPVALMALMRTFGCRDVMACVALFTSWKSSKYEILRRWGCECPNYCEYGGAKQCPTGTQIVGKTVEYKFSEIVVTVTMVCTMHGAKPTSPWEVRRAVVEPGKDCFGVEYRIDKGEIVESTIHFASVPAFSD